jgi:hypothetical protein
MIPLLQVFVDFNDLNIASKCASTTWTEQHCKHNQEYLIGSYFAAWRQYSDLCQMERTQLEAAELHRNFVLMRCAFFAWLQVLSLVLPVHAAVPTLAYIACSVLDTSRAFFASYLQVSP